MSGTTGATNTNAGSTTTTTNSKARVGLILKERISGTKSMNKSADLVALTERYQAFVKKIQAFVLALRHQHGSLIRLEKTRTELAAQIGQLTRGTPLWDCAGLLPSSDRPASTVCSYASIHDGLATKTKAYADKFGQFVITYAVEWERTVTTRIDRGLKTAETLRRDLDHYQKKVESLRLSTNQTMAKGKQVDTQKADKLNRNEEKFLKSKQEYNKFVQSLCILMEEVTERSWRDLHPVLIKLAQFDMTLADDEAKLLNTTMPQVISELKRLAQEHGLRPQARLKDLETLDPDLLCTKPGGPSNYHLTIENNNSGGGGFNGTTSYFAEPVAMPPGTVAPQGMGGFPVPVATEVMSVYPMTTTNNTMYDGGISTTTGPPMSTLQMLHISSSAAPPPTLEQVQAATSFAGTTPRSNSMAIRSAPNSGNTNGGYWNHDYSNNPNGPTTSPTTLPPLVPSNSSSYRRTSSFGNGVDYSYGGSMTGMERNDLASVVSAPAAPPPAAPPPPPPPMASGGQSPSLSMYPTPVAIPVGTTDSYMPTTTNIYSNRNDLPPPLSSSASSSYAAYGSTNYDTTGTSSTPWAISSANDMSNGGFGGLSTFGGGYGGGSVEAYPSPTYEGGVTTIHRRSENPNNPFDN